ncbi:hypothetical protein GS454_02480 [Rhodococcus hoagii]|nr:hypothetical protein [Prescottella equi]
MRSEWPTSQRISILNRRIVEIVYLGPDDDPATVAQELVSRGDPRWP